MTSLVESSPARRALRRLACVIAVLGVASGCDGGGNYFTRLEDSRRLAADLRLRFSQAADASNRAVMADTDEASIAFAGDAEDKVQLVESDVAALSPLLRSLGFSDELRILEEFTKHFAEYQVVDRTILGLAVENTNLKAQRLAFGPAREEADDFRDSLGVIASRIAPKDRCRGEGLIAKATLAVREIQILHAPHIAEANDDAMTKMEQEMDGLHANARVALDALTELVPPGARPELTTALSALDRFKEISQQIVVLSRRNSNVRSLELSLRTKPPLTSACDESLRALQNFLAAEGPKATR